MFCKNCGKEIDDGALFCLHCGEMSGAKELTSERRENKKKQNVRILIPVAALMLCLATGFTVYVLLKDPGNAGAGNPKAETEAAAAEEAAPGEEDEEPVQADTGEAEEAEVKYVMFNDAALEYAIRSETGIHNRGITAKEAMDITELTLSGERENEYGKIEDLTGLSAFKRLERVDLSYNSISDVSELGALENLTYINLEKNKVEDITPLQNLKALRELDLFTNDISDISAVSGLTELTMLDVRNNNLRDVESLRNLYNMQELYIGINRIKDISPIAGLTGLTYLSIGFNQIEDISALYDLTGLRVLTMRDNQIRDISVVSRLQNLYHLKLSGNPIEDYSPLESLPGDVEIIKD